MPKAHHYQAHLLWTGGERGPTTDVKTFSRAFRADIIGKSPIVGSSDANFLGDPALHNPEDLLLISLASCHMLSYLYQCAMNKISVTAYEDNPTAVMTFIGDTYAFTEVTLHPQVSIGAGDPTLANALHDSAHRACFIARSVNFPVRHVATILNQ